MWFCRNCYWRSFKFHGDARNAGNGNSENILVEFQDVCPGWRTGKFPDSRHWHCGADTKSSSYWCLASRSLDPIPRTSNGQQLSNHPKMAMVLSYIYLYRCLLSVNIYIYVYVYSALFNRQDWYDQLGRCRQIHFLVRFAWHFSAKDIIFCPNNPDKTGEKLTYGFVLSEK